MQTGETLLEMETRHVAEQKKRIARQEVLIERLRKAGILREWIAAVGAKTAYIEPGSP